MDNDFIDMHAVGLEVAEEILNSLVDRISEGFHVEEAEHVALRPAAQPLVPTPAPVALPLKRSRAEEGVGLSSILRQLRSEGQQSHASTSSVQSSEPDEAVSEGSSPKKQCRNEEPRTTAVFTERVENTSASSSSTVLNRKQRRALHFQQESQRDGENVSQQDSRTLQGCPTTSAEKILPAVLPSLQLLDVDEVSFRDYKASFGFGATKMNNYVHCVIGSPCGQFCVATSQDRAVRCYQLGTENKLNVLSKTGLGDLVYDVKWAPGGEGSNPLFATTARLHPIHLWDTDGKRAATYLGIDYADQVEAAMSIGFVGANRLYGGFNGNLRYWDVERPGRPIGIFNSFSDNGGTSGRIMSIEAHPTHEGMFVAVGCSNMVSVYAERWKCAAWTFACPARACTYAKYSPDGNYIFVSARKGDIYRIDVRTSAVVQTFRRTMTTSHRTRFDFDFERSILYSGTSHGQVVAFDLTSTVKLVEPISTQQIASTCVPAVSVDPKSQRLLACSGHREFVGGFDDSDDEDKRDEKDPLDNFPKNSTYKSITSSSTSRSIIV